MTCLNALFCLLLAAAPGKQLAIVEAQLHQFEDGPPLTASHRFSLGDPVFVSWRLNNYERTPGENPRLKVDWMIQVFDPDGVKVVEDGKGNFDAELAPQDKSWRPKARWDFVLPPLADPGVYRVELKAVDQLNQSSATQEFKFTVDAPEVEKSAALVARNFRFLRAEDDRKPLTAPAYRPGDTVWARFEMTGYKLGAGNEFAVGYGLQVLRPNGEPIYTEPNAALEKDKSFYRKRYVPGVLSLNLQKDIAKGEYTIILKLRDELGGQTAESRHAFTIE